MASILSVEGIRHISTDVLKDFHDIPVEPGYVYGYIRNLWPSPELDAPGWEHFASARRVTHPLTYFYSYYRSKPQCAVVGRVLGMWKIVSTHIEEDEARRVLDTMVTQARIPCIIVHAPNIQSVQGTTSEVLPVRFEDPHHLFQTSK